MGMPAPMDMPAQTEVALMEMCPTDMREQIELRTGTQVWVKMGIPLFPKVLPTMATGRSMVMATAMTRWIPTEWTAVRDPRLTGTTPDTMGTLSTTATVGEEIGMLPRPPRFLPRGTGSRASTTTTYPTEPGVARKVVRVGRGLPRDDEHLETP